MVFPQTPRESLPSTTQVRPTTAQEARSFLDMTNYCSRFIPYYSTITEPLRALTKSDQPWTWTSQHQQAFDQLKHLLASDTVSHISTPTQRPRSSSTLALLDLVVFSAETTMSLPMQDAFSLPSNSGTPKPNEKSSASCSLVNISTCTSMAQNSPSSLIINLLNAFLPNPLLVPMLGWNSGHYVWKHTTLPFPILLAKQTLLIIATTHRSTASDQTEEYIAFLTFTPPQKR